MQNKKLNMNSLNKIKYTVGFNNSGDPTVNKISTVDTTSAASLVSNGSFINNFFKSVDTEIILDHIFVKVFIEYVYP